MLRVRLNEALKKAMLSKDQTSVSTVRLILAALKDRDIAARTRAVDGGVTEDEILQLLQTMIKQRRESIVLYEKGGRDDLVKQEADEITIIEQFLPKQMTEDEIHAAIKEVIAELGAEGLKGMGGVMATLRERYAGRMDFGKASGFAKQALTG
ncbi:MAG: glutamyl-tRNA amidotransferase [Alphaproteobacteria bacterium RIFOXYD12_FULL_60_8]|nr:MAG: glutamyl-tRNA amidotransferase [Alphaproteobacteria bacterium RIFOXYD12_FULL_60_8]